MISMAIDMGPVSEFVEISRTALETLDRADFQADLVRAAMRHSVAEFALIADQVAESNPKNFHHVYEWGELGEIDGRLFRFIMGGSGRNEYVSYEFTESFKEVPPTEGSGGRGDAVFHFKARVLEEGGPRVINVGEKGFLAWFDKKTKEWRYSRESQVVNNAVDTQGQFTTLWNAYWSSMAADNTISREMLRPYQLKFKTTMERLFAGISKGHAVPTVGVTVNYRSNRQHHRRVVAELQSLNSREEAISIAKGAAAGIDRFGGI